MRIVNFILLLLWSAAAQAQPYYFRRFQVDQGLSHNTVTSLLQTRNGMIWAGTKSGLDAYNGHSFKSYTHKPGRVAGSYFVNALCEDRQGMIWMATDRGLFRFNPYQEVFTALPGARAPVSQVVADSAGQLWWLQNGTLCRLNPDNKRITIYTGIQGSAMNFDDQGQLWIGNHLGLMYCFNPMSNQVTRRIQVIGPHSSFRRKSISKILPRGDNILIGTAGHGLKLYRVKEKRLTALVERSDDRTDLYVRDIIYAGGDTYWAASESGIYVCNIRTGSLTVLRKMPADRYALSDNAVYSLLKDREGGIWAGTFFGGLNHCSPESIKFHKYINIKDRNSISGNAVREIQGDQHGNIWIGTEDAGLNKFDPKTGHFSHYTATGVAGSLSYPNIHGILPVGDRLYVGTFLHGMDILNTRTGMVEKRFPVIGAADGHSSDFVMSLQKGSGNEVLVGTIGAGLYAFDPASGQFTRKSVLASEGNIYAILEDKEGTVWAGSLEKGLFYYNLRKGIKGNIRFGSSRQIQYQIQGIFEDSRGALWLCTEGGGLIRLSPDRRTFRRITTSTGLPSNYLFRTLEDARGNLWISSLKGLVTLDSNGKNIRVFTQANGLITDQFNYNSAYKDSTGRMYFGTVQGLVAFDPADLSKKLSAPPIYLTGLQVNNHDVLASDSGAILRHAMPYTDTLTLRYDQSSFNLEFAALSYSSSRAINYKYRMSDIGMEDWTEVKGPPKAYFTDLSPGTYHFLVKAESNVGNWESAERGLVIHILPPFWLSTTAYVIYLALVLILIYLAASRYRKYLEAKNQRKLKLFQFEKDKEIYQAKIEFFTNIAHEIQTPLTLIRGPVERIMGRIEELPSFKKSMQLIDKNTNRLLSLSSQLLDFRKTEIDQFGLNFVNLNIVQVLKQEISNFKAEAEKKKMKIEVKVPKSILTAFVDYEAFTKIISNLLSNAIKYGTSQLKVELLPVKTGDENFVILLCNDGGQIGPEYKERIFEPFFRMSKNSDKPGTGIGLPIARSLAELHGGSLKLLQSDQELTIFELSLPIHHLVEFNLSKWKKMG
jgi:signal transduction histidine kinase/ligand-binding sensor domain-containing protein